MAGKRIFLEYITPLWKRMSFSQKTTARNLFRYKKRFFMTVLGVAGCTALLLIGFGLQDSLLPIVTKQSTELSHNDLTVTLSDPAAFTVEKGLTDALDPITIIFLISERLGIIYDTKPVKDPVKIGNVTTTLKRLVTVYLFHTVLRACSLP